MKKEYSNRQRKIYDDYSEQSTEKLLEIIKNKNNYLEEMTYVVSHILDERNEIHNYTPADSLIGEKDNIPENEFMENFFSPKGRIGRDQFFLRSILLNLTFLPLKFDEVITGLVESSLIIFYFLIIIAAYILNFIQKFKRFHDFNRSGWHGLWSIIPIVNIVIWFILIFTKGNDDSNKYGNPPKVTKHYKS